MVFPLLVTFTFLVVMYSLRLLSHERLYVTQVEPIKPPEIWEYEPSTKLKFGNQNTVGDLDYYSIFNPLEDSKDWTSKVQMVVDRKRAQNPIIDWTKNTLMTQTRFPLYYIEDYLLRKTDIMDSTLRKNVERLHKKDAESILDISDRHRPLITKFDYRFTLTMYLSYMSTNSPNLEQFRLPFSWYDWTDLGLIDEDIKFHFFWRWLINNYVSFPEKVKHELIILHHGRKMTEIELNEIYDPVRAQFNLNLDNFEMTLRDMNQQLNLCHVFKGDDLVAADLIDFIKAFYAYNFPACYDPEPSSWLLDMLREVEKGPATPLDKIRDIEKLIERSDCVNYERLSPHFYVPYPDSLSKQKKYQPSIGYNVIHGTRDQYHLVQRVIYGKLYLYNYHGISSEDIKPLKMVIMGDQMITVAINQDQEKRSERLLETDIVDLYIENVLMKQNQYNTLAKLYEARESIHVSFMDSYEDLVSKIKGQKLESIATTPEDVIDRIIGYIPPKSESDLYLDSFVNIDSSDTIEKVHALISEDDFLVKNGAPGRNLLSDMDYELAIEKRVKLGNISPFTDGLLKFYKLIKFLNGFIDVKKVPKYFFEARLLPEKPGKKPPNTGHYDWRFFNDNYHLRFQIQNLLSHLLGAWLQITSYHKLHTWIAHGTLLGWYFGGRNLPWDMDIDVQMPINDLTKLCFMFNQSVIAEDPRKGLGLYYLDCGSSITHRLKENGKNNIDARLVDTKTGFYIDITGISFSGSRTPERYLNEIDWEEGKLLNKLKETEFFKILSATQYSSGYKKLLEKKMYKNLQCNLKLQIVNCRNNHFFLIEDILPLRETLMEGEVAYVPNKYKDILDAEYGKKWRKPYFSNNIFIPTLGSWYEIKGIKNVFRRFLGLNTANINAATQEAWSKDVDQPPKLDAEWVSQYGEKLSKQFEDIVAKGRQDDEEIEELLFEEYRYPYNFLRQAEPLMLLDFKDSFLQEYLRVHELLEYHMKELEAFEQGKMLGKQERKNVQYSRPDFYLEGVVNGVQ